MKRPVLLLPLLLLAGCFQGWPENPAVPFAKSTFTALSRGNVESDDSDLMVVSGTGEIGGG